MPLTAADLEKRKSFLTASDVPAVIGISPFRTPLQVWADKTGQSEPWAGNDATSLGDDLEGAMIDRAARVHGLTDVNRNQWRVSSNGLLAATCDALALHAAAGLVGIEAKTSGIVNPGADLDAWGEDGTQAVPDYYAVQCQVQMFSAGTNLTFLSALLGRGMGGRIYPLTRDNESLKWIEDFCNQWWDRHMLKGIPPEATRPVDNSVIRYLRRVDTKSVVIDGALVTRALSAREAAAIAEEAKDMAEAALKLALGDAGIGSYGSGIVKYLEEGAADKVDLKGLKEAHPDIYARFATPNTRRVLRFPKTKAAK